MAVTVVRDAIMREHDPGPGHPERPARYGAAVTAIDRARLEVIDLPARQATLDEVARAHRDHYVDEIVALRGQATVLDPDTVTSPRSVDVVLTAAGAAIQIATQVASGKGPPGIAVVRPPGHHATPDRAMGFCLFNNVAVAARALIASGLAERIAIYDFDVHHGNGTQDIFYDDPNVLYLSTHQYPFYPGTGAYDETGRGAGVGATLNVPLSAGAGDAEMLAAVDNKILPAMRSFAPDVILLSAGFDAFRSDPVGGLDLSAECFGEIGRRVTDLAGEVADGKVAAVLEGGYHLDGLGRCVVALLESMSS